MYKAPYCDQEKHDGIDNEETLHSHQQRALCFETIVTLIKLFAHDAPFGSTYVEVIYLWPKLLILWIVTYSVCIFALIYIYIYIVIFV